MKRMLLCISLYCAVLSSCSKDPLDNLTEDESRIYITNYDTTVQFASYTSFKMADSIALLNNNQLRGKTRSSGDVQLLETLAAGLQQRGFARVQGSTAADLGVTITAITNTSTQLVSYTDYGGMYGGYWDPFYWGYSGYSYYFPTYYGIRETGETALAIDIVDLKNAAASNRLKVVWSGLIRGSGIFSNQNIEEQVTALLSQSPYLKK